MAKVEVKFTMLVDADHSWLAKAIENNPKIIQQVIIEAMHNYDALRGFRGYNTGQPDEYAIEQAASDYVRERYSTMDESFKRSKIDSVIENLMTASYIRKAMFEALGQEVAFTKADRLIKEIDILEARIPDVKREDMTPEQLEDELKFSELWDEYTEYVESEFEEVVNSYREPKLSNL